MNERALLDEALALALKLTPKQRIRLIEQVASSVEREIDAPPEEAPSEPWGEALVKLIQSLDMGDWEAIEMETPAEWLKELRREDEERLKPYWNGEK